MMLEKHLDQPVLIIKTAWGGKSLHYDFRPPSAGPYEPTANEKEQVEKWKAKKAAWDKYIAGGGTPAAMAQIQNDIKALDAQKKSLQDSITKLPKDQQAAEQAKLAALNATGKELSQTLVPPPGDIPTHDQAGFYWNEMIGFIRKVLADPKSYHPDIGKVRQFAGTSPFSPTTRNTTIALVLCCLAMPLSNARGQSSSRIRNHPRWAS